MIIPPLSSRKELIKMSNNSWSDSNNGNNAISSIIVFQVTDDMKKIGIKDFIFNRPDFEFTFTVGRRCCVLFSRKEVSLAVMCQ